MFKLHDKVKLTRNFGIPRPYGDPFIIEKGSEGEIVECVVSASSLPTYRVRFDDLIEAVIDCRVLSKVGGPMNITELARHMINIGGAVTPDSVPEWFRSVVHTLGHMPELSAMSVVQMEFVIKTHMKTRLITDSTDLVANVMFGLSIRSNPAMRTAEENLYRYKEHLDREWKKLNRVIPTEYAYAAMRAFVETK